MSERLVQLLEYAVLAPSRHNTQPWTFEIEGPELRVFADWSRALRVADPLGRALVMACGAATFNVEVAARALGMATSVEILAGSRRDALLARLRLEETHRPTAEEVRLCAAIPHRHTNRFGFDARPAPPGAIARLVRVAADRGARLRPVDDPLRAPVAGIVADATAAQTSSVRFRLELAAWSRTSDTRARDGVPGHAHGLSAPASVLHRVLARVPLIALGQEQRDRQHVLHSPALVALSTDRDRGADWFAAGRALQAVLLHATADGLAASFFSQAVEVPSARERLRDTLGERGWPQALFRVGYGRAVRPVPRRPVTEVLRSWTARPPPHAIVPVQPPDQAGTSA